MSPQTPLQVAIADLTCPAQAQAIVELLDLYAQDPMGAGQPLSEQVRQDLIPGLRQHPGALVWLAREDGSPVGVATGFLGFSTFQARGLLNVHDVAVHPQARGRGVGRALLVAIEQEARRRGCCKLTLEVRCDNRIARHLYQSCGFDPGLPNSTAMAFWTKSLGDRARHSNRPDSPAG